jgi:hypothetical protein
MSSPATSSSSSSAPPPLPTPVPAPSPSTVSGCLRAVWRHPLLEKWAVADGNPEFVACLAAAYAQFGVESPERAEVEMQWVGALDPLKIPRALAEARLTPIIVDDAMKVASCALLATQSPHGARNSPRSWTAMRAFAFPSHSILALSRLSHAFAVRSARLCAEARERSKKLAKEEVTRVFEVYAPIVARDLLKPLRTGEGPALIDMEALRVTFMCASFGDTAFAAELKRQRAQAEERALSEIQALRERDRAEFFATWKGEGDGGESAKQHALREFVLRRETERKDEYSVVARLGPSLVDRAFAPHPTEGFRETREEIMQSRILRRAVACGFDPRLASPSYLNPRKRGGGVVAGASLKKRLRQNADAAFGPGAFTWHDDTMAPAAAFEACVFGHCDATKGAAQPENFSEAWQLSPYSGFERRWRLTLVRGTGHAGSTSDAVAAYHRFRNTWANYNPNRPNPPLEFCVEMGGPIFEEFLAAKREKHGSLSREFLLSVVQAHFRDHDEFVERVLAEREEAKVWEMIKEKL